MYFDPISGKSYKLNAIKKLTGASTDNSYTYTLTETNVNADEVLVGTSSDFTLTESEAVDYLGLALKTPTNPSTLVGTVNYSFVPYIQFNSTADAIKVFNQLFAYMYLENGEEKYSSSQVATLSGNRIYLDIRRITSIQLKDAEYQTGSSSTVATANKFEYKLLTGDSRGETIDLSNISVEGVNASDLLPLLRLQAYYTLTLSGSNFTVRDGLNSNDYTISYVYPTENFKVFDEDMNQMVYSLTALSTLKLDAETAKTTLLSLNADGTGLKINEFNILNNTNLSVVYQVVAPDSKVTNTEVTTSTKIIKVADNDNYLAFTGFKVVGSSGNFTVQKATENGASGILNISGRSENILAENGQLLYITSATNPTDSLPYASGKYVTESQMTVFQQQVAKLFISNLKLINKDDVQRYTIITISSNDPNKNGLIDLIGSTKVENTITSEKDVVARAISYYYNPLRNDFIIEAYGDSAITPIYLMATIESLGADQTTYTFKDITKSVTKQNGEITYTAHEEFSLGKTSYFIRKTAEGLFAYDSTGVKVENATLTNQGLVVAGTTYPVKSTSTNSYVYTTNYFGKLDGSALISDSTNFANATLLGSNMIAVRLDSGKYLTYAPSLMNLSNQTLVSTNYFTANGYFLTKLGTDANDAQTTYYYYKDEFNTYKLVVENRTVVASSKTSYSTKVTNYFIVGSINSNLSELLTADITIPDSYTKLGINSEGTIMVTYTKSASQSNLVTASHTNANLARLELAEDENIDTIQKFNNFANESTKVDTINSKPLEFNTFYNLSGVRSWVLGSNASSGNLTSTLNVFGSYNVSSKAYDYIYQSTNNLTGETRYQLLRSENSSTEVIKSVEDATELFADTTSKVATVYYNSCPVLVYAKYNNTTGKFDVTTFILVYTAESYYNETTSSTSICTTDYAFTVSSSVYRTKSNSFNITTTDSLVSYDPLVGSSSKITAVEHKASYTYPITLTSTNSGLVPVTEINIGANIFSLVNGSYTNGTENLNLPLLYSTTQRLELKNSSSPVVFVEDAENYTLTYQTGGTYIKFNSVSEIDASVFTSSQSNYSNFATSKTNIFTFRTADSSINAIKLRNSESYLFYNCSNAKTSTYTVKLYTSADAEDESFTTTLPTDSDSLYIKNSDGEMVIKDIKFTSVSTDSSTSIIAKAYPSDLKSSAVTIRFSFDDTAYNETFYKSLNSENEITKSI